MEQHPVEIWDQVVRSLLAKGGEQADGPVGVSLPFQWEQLAGAKKAARADLLAVSCSKCTAEELALRVRHYQVFAGNLLHLIYGYKETVSLTDEQNMLCQQLTEDLDEMYTFLQLHFSVYFDFQQTVPISLLSSAEQALLPLLLKVKARFREVEKNGELLESFISIITSTLRPSHLAMTTFQQLYYCRQGIAGLLKLNLPSASSASYSPFVEALISYNFNDPDFLNKFLASIRESLAISGGDEEKLEQLRAYARQTAQIIERTTDLYCVSCSPAKEVVLNWLAQEMQFIKAEAEKPESKAITTSSDKIATSLSVPVLALYIRLFKETGLITNHNLQELFRAVSSTFITQRQAEVSQSHLHSKFYAVEESAKRKVFDQLMAMVHLCKKIQ